MTETVKKMISSFESERQGVHKTYKTLSLIGWPSLGAFSLLALIAFFLNWPEFVFFIAVPLALVGAGIGAAALAKRKAFCKDVASRLQNEINKELFPDAKYSPNGLPIQVILKPGFFEMPDRYYTADYMGASYEGIEFEKGHYRLQRRETHTDGRGHTTTTYVDYAVGTMYHFIYGRDFGGTLKVLEKSSFGFSKSGGLPKYETEFITFNKKFGVFSSDQQLVFYLLTPQIQEKILSLEGMAAGQFYMAFMKNELFVGINDSDNTISIPFNKPLDESSMGAIVEYMSIPAVFIELLGLTHAKFEKNAGVNV